MYCGLCGTQVPDGARFCQCCGGSVSAIVGAVPPISAVPGQNRSPAKKFVLALSGIGIAVVVLLILSGLFVWETFRKLDAAVSIAPQNTQFDKDAQSAKDSNDPLNKADVQPAPKSKRDSQMLRDAYASETQKDLWRQGMEMTFQARGTTLNVEYVLAGKAFAFQFGETFIGNNREMLRELGFKRVVLSDGNSSEAVAPDHEWTWDLTK